MGYAPNPERFAADWVDNTFESLTVDERIAQLMMIEVRPTYGATHLAKVRSDIKTYKVGGVIFFKGDPLTEVKLTNEFQAMSKTPLMVAIDGEWGIGDAVEQYNVIPVPNGA